MALIASTWIGKSTPSVLLGAVSLLPSEPSAATPPLGDERHRRRMQPGLGGGRVPRSELGEAAGVAGAHEQDVALADRHALLELGRLEVLAEDVLAGLEPRHPAKRGTSSSTPRPTRPSLSDLDRVDGRALRRSPTPCGLPL